MESNSQTADRILLLQSAMAAAPDLLQLGETFCHSCQALPGVGDVAFYHRQEFITGSARFDEPVHGTVQRLELDSVSGAMGLVLFSIVDEQAFAPYSEHLQLTTRLFSSLLENFDRCQEVMELNERLTGVVEERTDRPRASRVYSRKLRTLSTSSELPSKTLTRW